MSACVLTAGGRVQLRHLRCAAGGTLTPTCAFPSREEDLQGPARVETFCGSPIRLSCRRGRHLLPSSASSRAIQYCDTPHGALPRPRKSSLLRPAGPDTSITVFVPLLPVNRATSQVSGASDCTFTPAHARHREPTSCLPWSREERLKTWLSHRRLSGPTPNPGIVISTLFHPSPVPADRPTPGFRVDLPGVQDKVHTRPSRSRVSQQTPSTAIHRTRVLANPVTKARSTSQLPSSLHILSLSVP